MELPSFPRLSSNALKCIALVSMTIDHAGSILFPQMEFLRIIGRLAFPIFAYMIAEGCRCTSSRARYFCRVFLLGIAMQVFFWFVRHSLHQHILITFSMSIALIFSVQAAREKGGVRIAVSVLIALAESLICMFPDRLFPGRSFSIDYGFFGVLLPLLIYAGRNRTEKLIAAAGGLAAVCCAYTGIQWYSMLAIPLLALYSGVRGSRKLKYLFYAYYPLHLFVLEGIRLLRR